MKKTLLTLAIALGLSFSAFAQYDGGGLFQYGNVNDETYYNSLLGSVNYEPNRTTSILPVLPQLHGSDNTQNAPLGGGLLLLIGFGSLYATRRAVKRRE